MTVTLTMAQVRLLSHLGRYEARSLLFLVNAGFAVKTIDNLQKSGHITRNENNSFVLTEKGKNYV